MTVPASLRLLAATACLLPALCACAQSAPPAAPREADGMAPASASPRAASPPVTHDPGSGPDEGAVLFPPDGYHGSWRVVAADDPHDQALMAITVQSSAGQAEGSGDFVLFQPFCDAVADQPISGSADCELIDMAAAFDRVQATPERIVLAFHPTADGLEHRLELHRDGERLVGDYVIGEDEVRRGIVAGPQPGIDP